MPNVHIKTKWTLLETIAFPYTADAKYKLATLWRASRTHAHCPSLRMCPQMHARMHSNVQMWTRLCAFTETFLSAHLFCATFACSCFLLLSAANGGREGEKSWLSLWYLTSGCWNWCVCAVSIKQQVQKPTTERVLLADLVSFVISGKLAGWSVHVYNMHPVMVIMVKIVHIIMEFLRYKICVT